MSIRRLRYFVDAAEQENFGQAADRARIARPAFARHIHGLEVELGVRLFDRVGRGVRLTHAGHVYAGRAREILRAVDRAAEEVRQLARAGARPIRVGLQDFVGLPERVVQALREFRVLYPSAEIILRPMGSVAQIRALEAEDIDVGFVYNWPSSSLELAAHTIAVDQWVLAMRPDHRLASSLTIRLADLGGEDFVSVLPTQSPIQHSRLMNACAAGGLVPNIVQHAPNANGLFALVDAGLGIGFVTGLAAPPRNIAIRTVEDLSVRIPLDLMWRHDEGRADLVKFIESVSTGSPAPASGAILT